MPGMLVTAPGWTFQDATPATSNFSEDQYRFGREPRVNSEMHLVHHLGYISLQFTAQSSSSSINAWTRVRTMGPATPELYSAKASNLKVQRLLIGFRRSSRFPHAFAGAAQTAVVQVQAPVSRDLLHGYLR